MCSDSQTTRQHFDLSTLKWRLTGTTPWVWELGRSLETGQALSGEVGPVPARVPGSVQQALLEAGIVRDWNHGLQARECEWVENRHWLLEASLPDEWFLPVRGKYRLNCRGLDHAGRVYLNRREAGRFENGHVPHAFDITGLLRPQNNSLLIVFTCPPRWLGQFGRTSEIRDRKSRFYYTWDWVSRIVQIGVHDAIRIEAFDSEIEDLHVRARRTGEDCG